MNSFKTGWKENELKHEKEEFKQAIFGDFFVGGVMAGSLFIIIDSLGNYFNFNSLGRILIGIILIFCAIIPWVFRFAMKSKPDKI